MDTRKPPLRHLSLQVVPSKILVTVTASVDYDTPKKVKFFYSLSTCGYEILCKACGEYNGSQKNQ